MAPSSGSLGGFVEKKIISLVLIGIFERILSDSESCMLPLSLTFLCLFTIGHDHGAWQ